jgi:hypothetical protein
MCRVCSTHKRLEIHKEFLSENLKGHGYRWEVNIKMDLKERGYDGVDLINLARDWDTSSCEQVNEHSNL